VNVEAGTDETRYQAAESALAGNPGRETETGQGTILGDLAGAAAEGSTVTWLPSRRQRAAAIVPACAAGSS
jgi:hypothetical protein